MKDDLRSSLLVWNGSLTKDCIYRGTRNCYLLIVITYYIAEKFLLDKNFSKPSYTYTCTFVYVASYIIVVNFANAVKVAISFMQSLTHDKG